MAGKRLVWQIYPLFMLVILAAIIAATWYSTSFFHKFYLQQTTDKLKTLALYDTEAILPFIESSQYDRIDKFCKEYGKLSDTRITVIDSNGKVLGDSDENRETMENHSDRPEFIMASKNGFGRSIRLSHTLGKNMMYVAVPVKQQEKTVAFIRESISLNAIDEVLNNIYFKIASAGIFIAVITGLLSLMISNYISRPVVTMEKTAREFEQGHLESRVPIPNVLEFAGLAKTLNEMAGQLQSRINLITKQRNESEAILSNMIEGILAIDAEANIVTINKTTADLFHLQPEKIKGKHIEEVIRNSELHQFAKDAINSVVPIQKDIIIYTDIERSFQFHGTGISDEKGKRSGAVIVFNDITEVRKLENIRRDFVANVSHELRTPITSIKGFVETLLDGEVADEQQVKRFLEIIAKHADRLNSIIADLLSLSQLEEGQSKKDITLQKETLLPVLAAAIELSSVKSAPKEIKFDLKCADNLKANISSPLLEQAVFNLIDNAIKYSDNGREIKISAEQKEREIVISVEDSGCGIEQKYLERIFERFYVVDKSRSRKLGGTGLGLAIVKHIAQVHGGSVTVESTLGKGSIFIINLPAD